MRTKIYVCILIIMTSITITAQILEFQAKNILWGTGIDNKSYIIVQQTSANNYEIYDANYIMKQSFSLNYGGTPQQIYIHGVSEDFDDDSGIEILYQCTYDDSIMGYTYSSFLENIDTGVRQLTYEGNDSIWYFAGTSYFNSERYVIITEYLNGSFETNYGYRSGITSGISVKHDYSTDNNIVPDKLNLIEFSLDISSNVQIEILDINGRVVNSHIQ